MQNRKAFTLIELLVVVAIIALLVSLLLPTLAEAMKLARLSVCETNLHYTGLGLNLYADAEGEGDFPIGRWSYPWDVYHVTRAGEPDAMAGRIGMGALYPDYVSTPETFYCPQTRGHVWDCEGPYGWEQNFPIMNHSACQTWGIYVSRLYGECSTTPRKASKTAVTRAGFGMSIPTADPKTDRVGVLPPDISYLFIWQKVR
jgi:prepilin-type N-terminal cleavage/methylation domain-containing protein